MALSGVALDDNKAPFINNCFPVRSSLGRFTNEASGKWLEVQQNEQKRRLKTLLSSQPLTYARIKEKRKKTEKQGVKLDKLVFHTESESGKNGDKILDGFFLVTHCCVDDPSDLCSINILNQELTDVKEDDLAMFDNVAYINAGENYLPLEAFRGFPSLRELELPLNGLRSIHISYTDFKNLEMLDLSYNNLSQGDLLTLGLLSSLKILHLTGNNLSSLPADLAMPYVSKEKHLYLERFTKLEVLLLDDNRLKEISLFASLAGLPKLVHLDLSKNEIFFVPQLKSVEGRLVTQESSFRKSGKKSSSQKSSRKSSRARKADSLMGSNIDSSEKMADNAVNPEDADSKVIKETTLQDLMTEDFGTDELLSKIDELDLETETTTMSANEKSRVQKPPFPELRYLNLANNKISEEEGLLALAAWPMLAEVDIYKNPLTMETSGDPPLLKRFLQDRLGVKLNRRKPEELQEIRNKKGGKIHPKSIKITDHVPKVPKVSVESKMLLGAAITAGALGGSFEISILPPISPETKAGIHLEEQEEEAKGQEEVTSQAFFMTQLNDQDRFAEASHARHGSENTFADVLSAKISEEDEPTKFVDDKYKSYELLLSIEDLDDESDLPPPSDVQGNVRALKHTLNHLLVYRDPAVDLTKVKMMVPERRKDKSLTSLPVQTYQEKVDTVLSNLKQRKTFEEDELSSVLKDKNLMKKKFPEAENLIGHIQKRYNAVRVHSLKQAKSAREMSGNFKQSLPTSGLH
ncbi:X-ray radiation resistance-associated protein 1-like isoform X1 [Biomphalaria pfeifferi]|uniref:X-ray radiation resistance-associated protein 1-like isoform X1 n=1 Tax=Biomphalaria pfeifferi TaxID=112525 RepID=A0AAD8B6G0_BIOPF|nr:X-ray radiation resistance-associated protein 1-like isoform X1 [Biomphalaria pfeifferi]